jgi:hypothetical protein
MLRFGDEKVAVPHGGKGRLAALATMRTLLAINAALKTDDWTCEPAWAKKTARR